MRLVLAAAVSRAAQNITPVIPARLLRFARLAAEELRALCARHLPMRAAAAAIAGHPLLARRARALVAGAAARVSTCFVYTPASAAAEGQRVRALPPFANPAHQKCCGGLPRATLGATASARVAPLAGFAGTRAAIARVAQALATVAAALQQPAASSTTRELLLAAKTIDLLTTTITSSQGENRARWAWASMAFQGASVSLAGEPAFAQRPTRPTPWLPTSSSVARLPSAMTLAWWTYSHARWAWTRVAEFGALVGTPAVLFTHFATSMRQPVRIWLRLEELFAKAMICRHRAHVIVSTARASPCHIFRSYTVAGPLDPEVDAFEVK